MRKLCLPLAVFALAAGAAGCEDGPNQTFSPAPGNPGWNTGTGDAAVGPGSQNFDAGYPTSNATSLCSTDFKRQRWSWMLSQPVVPPRFYAGLDMAKNNLWEGLKVEDAEQPPLDPQSKTGGLCQSVPGGFVGTCPSGYGGCNFNSWGNNQEVSFIWNVATHYVDQMILGLGYTGTLATKPYPDHLGEKHAYSFQLGDVIRRDGVPFYMQWQDTPTVRIQITDIFNAMMATFANQAGVPFDTKACSKDADCAAPGQVNSCQCKKDMAGNCAGGAMSQCGAKNCGTDGNCLVYNDGSQTIFGVRPMVIYITGLSGVPQPALSTPLTFYNFFSKWEPFVHLNQTLKLDADGPNATGTPIGAKNPATICDQKIGQTFADFRDNCVQVHGDKGTADSVDDVNLNKVTHSLAHDQEHWTANVLGVNQNFTSISVLNDPEKVVLDADQPQPTDIAQDFFYDIRARGKSSNDYKPGATANTFGAFEERGSGLLMIEFARLMLAEVSKLTGKPATKLGDPRCLGFTGTVPNYKLNPNVGCSGIEGLLIPGGGAGDFTKDPGTVPVGALDPGNNFDGGNFYNGVIRPRDVSGIPLCIDPGLDSNGVETATDCTVSNHSLFFNILSHVTRVMGGGDINKLPSAMRDRRFYYRSFGEAFVKYLKAYGNYGKQFSAAKRDSYPDGTVGGGLAPSDVMKQVIDRESLFFDYLTQPGSGSAQTFDKFEYVDRDFIGTGNGGAYNWIPWDFEYGGDLFGGNNRNANWFRRMDREEIGLYSAMLENKTNTPGKENNVNITNLFGSTMLGGDPAANVAGLWPSYACAAGIAGDINVNCGGQNAPLEAIQSKPCRPGACTGGDVCTSAVSYENGVVSGCGPSANFTTFPVTGCPKNYQTAAVDLVNGTLGCLDAAMDLNAHEVNAKTLLSYYPSAWTRSPFSRGHSPITIKDSDKRAKQGVAHVSIPNYAPKSIACPDCAGPYTASPAQPDAMGACLMGWTKSANGVYCNAPLNTPVMNQAQTAASFNPLTPWLEVQPGVGFGIPVDAQHTQWVSAGQFDYTGVLESYVVDYVPFVDPKRSSCISDGACNKGFTCDPTSHACVTDDNTVQILAVEGQDFLGESFACYDAFSKDVLHVRMYDSAQEILDWLAAHPGGWDSVNGVQVPPAQTQCNILIRRTQYDNFIDEIISKTYGVALNVGGGQGLGRVTDIILFDPSIVQSL